MLKKNTDERLTVRDTYQQKVDKCNRELREIKRRDDLVSKLRGLSFFASVGCLLMAWIWTGPVTLWLVAAAVLFIIFVGLCGYHEHLERKTSVVDAT